MMTYLFSHKAKIARLQWERLYLLVILVFPSLTLAQEYLTLNDVLDSSLQHFPQINAELARKQAQEASLLQAQGAFDPKLKQENLFWASGFYDGQSVDTKVIQPLQNWNARVTGGYRISNGDFPIYQNVFNTQTAGEFNIEFWFSLLRNRDIDSRRVNVRNEILGLSEAEFKVLLTQLKVQLQASHAYWQWLGSGQQLRIYESLLALAKKRQEALEEQNRVGEVADIQLIENERNMLTRQSLVRDAQQRFTNAAVNLSLYLRNDDGNPAIAESVYMPMMFPEINKAIMVQIKNDFSLPGNQLELAIIDQKLEQQRNLEALAENDLLPQIDVGVKAARDIGAGSSSLDGNDLIFQMSVEVPIGTRKQRGKISEIRAKIDELEFDKRLLQDQILVEIRKLVEIIDANITFIDLTSQELQLARKLEEAEKIRFSAGESDFFLINLREQQTADAQVRQYKALQDYFKSLANYQAATVQLDAFGIQQSSIID